MLVPFGIFLIVLFLSGLRISQAWQQTLVFRLGKLNRVRQPGLFWIIPWIEHITPVDMRTVTTSVDQQETITRDNVPVKVTAVIWYEVVYASRAILKVKDVDRSVVQIALTSLRNIMGRHSLDEVLKEQESISQTLCTVIDKVTEPWGVKVSRVEMRNVEIPESMQRAMAQEAEALREKRARLIKAQAELEASLKLKEAAGVIMENPAGLELRRMQMITEVGAEQNTTTIIMMPSEFVTLARNVAELAHDISVHKKNQQQHPGESTAAAMQNSGSS